MSLLITLIRGQKSTAFVLILFVFTLFCLGFVFLQENRLTGTIPSLLFSKKRMKQILLNDNRLTGTLPSVIGQMKDLGESC